MMTSGETDELVRDLERAGVQVEAVEPRPHYDGEWQLRCWCPKPAHSYTIGDATVFREAVHNRLTPVLLRGALD
jgi:hypothetical protein